VLGAFALVPSGMVRLMAVVGTGARGYGGFAGCGLARDGICDYAAAQLPAADRHSGAGGWFEGGRGLCSQRQHLWSTILLFVKAERPLVRPESKSLRGRSCWSSDCMREDLPATD